MKVSLFVIVVVSLHLKFGKSQIVYISPSQAECTLHYKPCLLLNQLAKDTLQIVNITVIFLPGNHVLSHTLSFSNILRLSLFSTLSLHRECHLICQQNSAVHFSNVSHVWIRGIKLFGCGNNYVRMVKQFFIENCTFYGQNDSGTALKIKESHVNITDSKFILNTVGSCVKATIPLSPPKCMFVLVGGAIYVMEYSYLTVANSYFESNGAEVGGAIYADSNNGDITIITSTFVRNQVAEINKKVKDYHCRLHKNDTCVSFDKRLTRGGVMATYNSSVKMENSIFRNNNNKEGNAGVLAVEYWTAMEIHSSQFYDNHAKNRFGGVLMVNTHSNVTIVDCTVYNSSSLQGGFMDISKSLATIKNSNFSHNLGILCCGVIIADRGSHLRLISSLFTNNSANTGGVLCGISTNIIVEDCKFVSNHAKKHGGSIHIFQSQLTFGGNTTLKENLASVGGAVYSVQCSLYAFNETKLLNNTANQSGGGIYLYRSQLNCQYSCTIYISGNRAKYNGGGIHAINSKLLINQNRTSAFQSCVHFVRNVAQKGGGVYLESLSVLYVEKIGFQYRNRANAIYFESNSAHFGEAIYVSDETYFDVCSRGVNTSIIAFSSECFFQVLSPETTFDNKYQYDSMSFVPNSLATSIIYGGLLDRCTINQFAEVVPEHIPSDGIAYLKRVSNINDVSRIMSGPVRLCLCSRENQPNCSISLMDKQVAKGDSFNLILVAVDQVNNTVENVMVHSLLGHPESGLGNGQLTQITRSACTTLHFNVFSPYSSEDVGLVS